jgi:hypothetical protein
VAWLLPRLVIFAAGVAAGYYVRDREIDRLQAAYDATRTELEELKQTGENMLEQGRRTGETLRAGAEAAVDSTKSAVEELKGGKSN